MFRRVVKKQVRFKHYWEPTPEDEQQMQERLQAQYDEQAPLQEPGKPSPQDWFKRRLDRQLLEQQERAVREPNTLDVRVGGDLIGSFCVLGGAEMEALRVAQLKRAIYVGETRDRRYFWHADDVWWSDNVNLPAADATTLAVAANLRRERAQESEFRAAAAALVEPVVSGGYRREHIPTSVRQYVWNRDHGRCVDCGGKELLEYDHIIPVSMGGSHTDRNLQLLCGRCNRAKGASLGAHS